MKFHNRKRLVKEESRLSPLQRRNFFLSSFRRFQNQNWNGAHHTAFVELCLHLSRFRFFAKLSTPSTLNIDFIQWHTQLIMCAVKWITHDLIHDFHFTFQAYALPHTLNGICVSLFKFHTWILRQFLLCPKRPALPRPIKVLVSFECLEYLVYITLPSDWVTCDSCPQIIEPSKTESCGQNKSM